MNIQKLSQGQAAALAGVTARRLRQMAHEANPPPQDRYGGYPAVEFSRWLANSRRVPAMTEEERQASRVGAFNKMIHEVIANYAGGVLESSKPRDVFLVMCIDNGISRRDALVAYVMQAFSLALAAEEVTEVEDFGIAVPPDGFWREVSGAMRDGTLDEFITKCWPEQPTPATGQPDEAAHA